VLWRPDQYAAVGTLREGRALAGEELLLMSSELVQSAQVGSPAL
jgi:hypothetical protein